MSRRHRNHLYRERNGLGYYDEFKPCQLPTEQHKAAIRAWNRVWQSLTKRQQEAWHALGREEKDTTYAMTAVEFAKFMRELVKKAA